MKKTTDMSDAAQYSNSDRLQLLYSRIVEGGYVSVPDGWIDLVLDLHEKISYIDPDYKIVQAKEKFGGLRYYINHSLDGIAPRIISDLIFYAESRSLKLCQVCGSTGSLVNSHGRYSTFCPQHQTSEFVNNG